MIQGITYSPVELRPNGAGLFSLGSECCVEVETDSGVITIYVGEGFLTDMGSVPRWIRGWIDYIGSQDQAMCYLVHDALYGTQGRDHQWSKPFVDELFYDMMCYLGTQNAIKRWLIYTAVDAGGWSAWEDFSGTDVFNSGLVRTRHGV